MALRATGQFLIFLGQALRNLGPRNVGAELTGKKQADKSN